MDNLERALGSPSGSTEQLRTGVEMNTAAALPSAALPATAVNRMTAAGQPFDPHRQEAVGSRRGVSSQPIMVVLKVVQPRLATGRDTCSDPQG